MFRINHFDLHHFDFFPAPELFFSGPLVRCGLLIFFEGLIQGEEIVFLSLCIEPGPKWVLKSMKPSFLIFEPEDHRGVKRVEIKKPSLNLHRNI